MKDSTILLLVGGVAAYFLFLKPAQEAVGAVAALPAQAVGAVAALPGQALAGLEGMPAAIAAAVASLIPAAPAAAAPAAPLPAIVAAPTSPLPGVMSGTVGVIGQGYFVTASGAIPNVSTSRPLASLPAAVIPAGAREIGTRVQGGVTIHTIKTASGGIYTVRA